MHCPRTGFLSQIPIFAVIFILVIPAISLAEDYKVFTSEEFGFSMKYPATWVKIEPQGNYYVVFQAPDLTDGFRNSIRLAAHKPVKDALDVYLQELRNGIKDLQKGKEKQEVRIVDEGEFRSEVPGAYYFVIQALEKKVWMDIVIVFYKHDQTLLRISCLAPSQSMEKLHQMFNDVLVSVRFAEAKPEPSPSMRPMEVQPAPPAGGTAPAPVQPSPPGLVIPEQRTRPAPPPSVTPQPEVRPGPPSPTPESAPDFSSPSPGVQPDQNMRQMQPPPAPRPGPRAPVRQPEKPATGIVN